MASTGFDDRVARLEEHVVKSARDADYYLDRAEKCLARGWNSEAGSWLNVAKIARAVDQLEAEDYDEEEVDGDH